MDQTAERWWSLVLTFLFSFLGLCGYILYIYVISKDRQQRFANPFYRLTLSWSIPELYRILQGLIVSVPVLAADIFSATGSSRVPKWYRTVTGFLYMAAWLATVSHMLALAVNRLTAVYWPAEYKRLYTHTRCAAILLSCYFYSVFLTALMLFGGCRADFIGFSWRVVSSSNAPPVPYNQTHMWPVPQCSLGVHRMYLVTWNGLVVLTVICDFCAVLGVLIFKKRMHERFHRRSLRRLVNRQWSLTAQFTVTVGLLVTNVCVYWLGPAFVRHKLVSQSAMSVFTNSVMLCACALNPYIYIVLGAMVRRQVFGLHKHSSQQSEHLTGSYAKRQVQGCVSSAC